ncbi:MAG: SDR family NAD(P)-dependent oxidoreductase [Vicinamibacteria bacterium]|nr:SDR family NAD(P)-dependent oxidoreductase [Vicinamibacteria bacterium]
MTDLLITGATGLLGRRLLRECCAAGMEVALLVRPGPQGSAAQRVDALMEEIGGSHKLQRPRVVEGDLADPALAQDPALRDALAASRAVIHCAASLSFVADPATGEPERTNTAGTARLLELCRVAGVREFHHVSTAYVNGARRGRVLETETAEAWNNPYERSKARAEAQVAASGIPSVTIYRPSIVIGDALDPATVALAFDTPVRLAGLLGGTPDAEELLRLLALRGDEGKNLVPVGWVVQALLAIVRDPRLHGRTYHLTHPQATPVRAICEAVAAALEHPRRPHVSPAAMSAIEQGLAPYRPYLRDDPEFDATNTRAALPGLPCPELAASDLLAAARAALRRAAGPALPAPAAVDEGRLLHEPLAIVGMACRLPGAPDLDALWDLVAAGRSALGELPPERLDRDLYFDPRRGTPGRTYTTIGGLVAQQPPDPWLSAHAAEALERADPCHAGFCSVAVEALRDAGLPPPGLEGRRIGVWVGHSGGSPRGPELAAATLAADTASHLGADGVLAGRDPAARDQLSAALAAALREGRPRRDAQGGPALEANEAAALVARSLGLTGPALAIDAACASSLVALALAALALQRGEVEAAVVGGASWNKAESLILFSQAQSCSASGSRPFDQRADGLVASEGQVAIVVKTLARALADGDRVRAVVRGIGLASDGRSRHLWAPRREGQLAALARAYGPGVEPARVQYVEAHATSTAVGDATELQALGEFFAPHLAPGAAAIGSLKSNLGHTLETAGLASLVKTVLAIERERIPPTVGVEEPNREVDWEHSPFALARELRPWPQPADGGPRRAGVSAFGIGGLDAHVVVDEFRPESAPAVRRAVPRPEIAIVGRGLVLPGAFDVPALGRLLESGDDVLGAPPDPRWRDESAVVPGPAQPWLTPSRRGGYLVGYPLDWRRLRVPPLQLARANPLQFLLLDVVRQALRDSGRGRAGLDRARTAVVVGSVFGGDFANQLQAGLRLPEARRHLLALLPSLGLASAEAERVADAFEQAFLASRPALLDETGSFTSSTLASRIAKTFDLMGGALAIDAGEASSLAALDAAAGLLESGACSAVVCAAAQRAMDLVAFEALSLQGWLAERVPGEGVAAVMLKPLAAARRDGDRVHGVLRRRGTAFAVGAPEVAVARSLAHGARGAASPARLEAGTAGETEALAAAFPAARRPDPLAARVGHLGAAHGLACVVRATLEGGETAVATGARAGFGAHVVVAAATPTASSEAATERVRLRLAAPTLEALAAQAAAAVADLPRALDACPVELPPGRFALVAVAAEVAELREALELAARHLADPRSRGLLDERGLFVRERPATPPRVAWLFPGQGSQYEGMLDRIDSPAARQVRAAADAALAEAGTGSGDAEAVATQVGMLVADLCFAAAATESGLKRDVVAGHSYGELPALVAAGAIDLGAALRLTLARARAVAAAPVAGGLLSLAADAESAAAWLADAGSLWITHCNAPRQTVVGGARAALEALRQRLADQGVASRPLAVAGALHTPLMAAAGEAVAAALRGERLRPPTTPFLSNVSLRHEAEPAALCENLAGQLVRPLQYVDLVRRLRADGHGVLLEVGPGQVLTGLHRQILAGEDVELFALDHPRRPLRSQLARAGALLECLGAVAATELARPGADRPAPPAHLVEEFDATRPRRRRTARRAGRRPRPDAAAAPAAGRTAASSLERFVVDFVVEHTGYPREAVRLDWDLEADLGVDSIKRAQLLGELGELIGLDEARTRALGSARHLGELVARAEAEARAVGFEIPSRSRDERGASAAHPEPALSHALVAPEPALATRYVVRVEPAPLRPGTPELPRLAGAMAVLGDPGLAAALRERLPGARVHDLPADAAAAVAALDAAWAGEPVPHLVLSARAADAGGTWASRRAGGVDAPFWLAQRWWNRVRQADLGDDATLTAVTHLGGAFGTDLGMGVPDGGALCGLLKAVSVEGWVAGLRALSVRAIDAAPDDDAADVAALLLRELAAPGHDLEVAWSGGSRGVVRVAPQPVPAPSAAAPRPAGTWVCTGGARGITALIARELGVRYGLTLHLLGTAPAPEPGATWGERAARDRQALRLEVMDVAHAAGRNAVRDWQAVEKAIEIEATLRALAAAGVEAHYHRCDVGDAVAVRSTLEEVRRRSGPITGVLHGAGWSRDARFEDKRRDQVERCLAAKVDGAVHLLEATASDPVRHFLAMGSISGRFGANGHADYSLANDLLAKCVARARRDRSALAATTFHWHAWDDAGMATRPESRHALELAGLRFMPAREGVAHLVAELEAGLPEAEVVVTDERYPRLYQPLPEAPCEAALLAGAARTEADGEVRFALALDPAREPLLQDHRLEGEPLLPLVAGLELMCEAAALAQPGFRPTLLRDVEALQPVRFPRARPRDLTLRVRPAAPAELECAVLVDVRGPDGRLIEKDRLAMRARVAEGPAPDAPRRADSSDVRDAILYAEEGAPLWHGPRFRTLRRVRVEPGRLVGRLSAPAVRELGGVHRGTLGWRLSCGALDGCLYAVGVLAWHAVRAGQTLPARIAELWLGRLPDPGEACLVEARLQHAGAAGARFDFDLRGADGALLAAARGYEIAWRGAAPAPLALVAEAQA